MSPYPVESPDSGEPQGRFGGGTEELEDGHGRGQLLGRDALHVHHGLGCLVDHDLVLVAQAALNEVKHRAVRPGIFLCNQLAGDTDLYNVERKFQYILLLSVLRQYTKPVYKKPAFKELFVIGN